MKMPNSDERNAVELLKKGSSKGFCVIFHLYHKQLFFISRKIIKDHSLAEDVVQDVFIKLWLNREKLDPDKSIKGFLTTCLRNHIRNTIRDQKKKILGSYELKEENHPRSQTTADDLLWREYRTILQNGIEYLPTKRQQIYRMKVYDGLTNSEISEQLKVSVNTVKAHFFQANKFMKRYLEEKTDIIFKD